MCALLVNDVSSSQAFQGDPPTTVFLLSIRSGAVGINLTAANHVFLLEPCINPALEEQVCWGSRHDLHARTHHTRTFKTQHAHTRALFHKHMS